MKRLAFTLLSLALLMGCSRKEDKSAAPTASVSPPASAQPASAPSGEAPTSKDEVQPVYPMTNLPPNPLAARLCEALHGVPLNRKATCCGHSPGFSLVPECTRTLTYALSENAVALDPKAVDACASAMEKAHEGCEWVGPTGAALPKECANIVRGTVADGQKCRSSLECVDGLRCIGVGPTDAGVCRKPLQTGYPCSLAVDTLAALTRQDDFEARHPECSGYCAFKRCDDLVPAGGECRSSLQCGAGKACLQGKCTEGELPGEGKACGAKGACGKGLHCEKGKCLAPKNEGSACENDIECRGGCLRGDAGRGGTCGMKCTML